jgi:transcriptional regulator with XRE-family HTH domain
MGAETTIRAVSTPDEETVGQRIRRLRLARGMSQRQLASKGVSYAYLSRIEAGQRTPSVKAIRLLATRLGVSADYLETGSEAAKEREMRLREAELEIRLGRDLALAERKLAALIAGELDEPTAARAHAALGMLAAGRADNATAVREFEEAVEAGSLRPESRADVFEALAAAYVAIGDPYKATALLQRCIAAVDEHAPDDVTAHVRYRTFLGTTYSAIGDLPRARAILAEATERAEGYEAPSARVVLYASLARLAWMQNELDEALSYMARAIGLLEASDDTLQLARMHLLAGQLCGLEGRIDEAEQHLAQAERLLVLGGDRDDVGILRAEQARIAALKGDPKSALALAEEALEALRDDVRHAPTAWHSLALAQVAAGDLVAAEKSFELAVDGLAEQKAWRQAASAARDWANAVRAAGRNEDAYQLLERALLLDLRETPRR